jgi:HlyD family secretion protein
MTDSAKPIPRKAGSRIAIGLIALALVATGVTYVFLPKPEPAPEQAALPVADTRVKALGQILPVSDLLTIAGPTGQDAGRIATVRVAEGQEVKAGDVLAVLDTEPVSRALLAQAKANVDVQRAALAAKSADLDSAERQFAAQVGQQDVALQKALLELDNKTKLKNSGLYQDSALDDLRLNVESARYTLKNTQIELDRTKMRSKEGLRLDEASAQAQMKSAEAALENAQADYDNAFIRAPINGRILAVFGKVGEQIGNDGFAQIADTSVMEVRAEVYESDISKIVVDQKATVTSRALPSSLAGRVTRIGVRISDQSILSTDPAAVVDARIIEVWLRLDEASSKATRDLSGLQVVATFDPVEKPDA